MMNSPTCRSKKHKQTVEFDVWFDTQDNTEPDDAGQGKQRLLKKTIKPVPALPPQTNDKSSAINTNHYKQCKIDIFTGAESKCDKTGIETTCNATKHERQNQHKDFRYQCQYCGITFRLKRLLDTHFKDLHSDNDVFKCPNCKYFSTQKERCLDHMKLYNCKKRKSMFKERRSNVAIPTNNKLSALGQKITSTLESGETFERDSMERLLSHVQPVEKEMCQPMEMESLPEVAATENVIISASQEKQNILKATLESMCIVSRTTEYFDNPTTHFKTECALKSKITEEDNDELPDGSLEIQDKDLLSNAPIITHVRSTQVPSLVNIDHTSASVMQNLLSAPMHLSTTHSSTTSDRSIQLPTESKSESLANESTHLSNEKYEVSTSTMCKEKLSISTQNEGTVRNHANAMERSMRHLENVEHKTVEANLDIDSKMTEFTPVVQELQDASSKTGEVEPNLSTCKNFNVLQSKVKRKRASAKAPMFQGCATDDAQEDISMRIFMCLKCNYFTTQKERIDRHMELYHSKQQDSKSKETSQIDSIGMSLLHGQPVEEEMCQPMEVKSSSEDAAIPNVILSDFQRQQSTLNSHCQGMLEAIRKSNEAVINTDKSSVTSTDAFATICVRNQVTSRNGQYCKRQHLCFHCNKSFTEKTQLQVHIRAVHAKGKNFVCPACKRVFRRKDTLRTHMKTHNLQTEYPNKNVEGRKFKCHLCSKAFCYPQDLQRHINEVHKKIKNFRCPVCNWSFSRSSNLKTHLASVHSEVIYHDVASDRQPIIYTTAHEVYARINNKSFAKSNESTAPADEANVSPVETSTLTHISSTCVGSNGSASLPSYYSDRKIFPSSSKATLKSIASRVMENTHIPTYLEIKGAVKLPGRRLEFQKDDMDLSTIMHVTPETVRSTQVPTLAHPDKAPAMSASILQTLLSAPMHLSTAHTLDLQTESPMTDLEEGHQKLGIETERIELSPTIQEVSNSCRARYVGKNRVSGENASLFNLSTSSSSNILRSMWKNIKSTSAMTSSIFQGDDDQGVIKVFNCLKCEYVSAKMEKIQHHMELYHSKQYQEIKLHEIATNNEVPTSSQERTVMLKSAEASQRDSMGMSLLHGQSVAEEMCQPINVKPSSEVAVIASTLMTHHKGMSEAIQKSNEAVITAGKISVIPTDAFTATCVSDQVSSTIDEEHKKKHRCFPCDKAFTTKRNLQVHIREVHVGEKNFVCEVCNRAFGREYTLNRHMKTHTWRPKYPKKNLNESKGQYPRSQKQFSHKVALESSCQEVSIVAIQDLQDIGQKTISRQLLEKSGGYTIRSVQADIVSSKIDDTSTGFDEESAKGNEASNSIDKSSTKAQDSSAITKNKYTETASTAPAEGTKVSPLEPIILTHSTYRPRGVVICTSSFSEPNQHAYSEPNIASPNSSSTEVQGTLESRTMENNDNLAYLEIEGAVKSQISKDGNCKLPNGSLEIHEGDMEEDSETVRFIEAPVCVNPDQASTSTSILRTLLSAPMHLSTNCTDMQGTGQLEHVDGTSSECGSSLPTSPVDEFGISISFTEDNSDSECSFGSYGSSFLLELSDLSNDSSSVQQTNMSTEPELVSILQHKSELRICDLETSSRACERELSTANKLLNGVSSAGRIDAEEITVNMSKLDKNPGFSPERERPTFARLDEPSDEILPDNTKDSTINVYSSQVRLLRIYNCMWCNTDNKFVEKEMDAHLVQNHSTTLNEYLDMNHISWE